MTTKTEMTALAFYKSIKKDEDIYKLVNGLFIVKNISQDICVFVGDFSKAGSALNHTNRNEVIIFDIEPNTQMFNRKDCTTQTSLSLEHNLKIWKKLTIPFKEEPIRAILRF